MNKRIKEEGRREQKSLFLRLETVLHTDLKVLCANKGISMQQFCENAIELAINKQQFKKGETK